MSDSDHVRKVISQIEDSRLSYKEKQELNEVNNRFLVKLIISTGLFIMAVVALVLLANRNKTTIKPLNYKYSVIKCDNMSTQVTVSRLLVNKQDGSIKFRKTSGSDWKVVPLEHTCTYETIELKGTIDQREDGHFYINRNRTSTGEITLKSEDRIKMNKEQAEKDAVETSELMFLMLIMG